MTFSDNGSMGRTLTICAFLLLVLLPVKSLFSQAPDIPAASSPGLLRTQGLQIVNDRGPVILRGVNLGNWLFWEGYIFGAQQAGQQSQTGFLESLGQLVMDSGVLRNFRQRWRETFLTQEDMEYLASLGFNHVRLPLHWDLFLDPQTGKEIDDGFFWIDRLLEWCRPLGIYVIPDLHAAPGGQNSNHVSDRRGEALFWKDYRRNLELTKKIWGRLARRYAQEPWIGGWDLLNEPEVREGKERLREAYIQITRTIRAEDPHHMIIAEGNWFATSFWELLTKAPAATPRDAWDKNLVFSFHSYWAPLPNPSLKDQLAMAGGAGVPVWLGEFGENSNYWLASQVADMENRGIGWSFWTYKKVEAINALVEVRMPPTWRKVLDHWKGGPQPTPEETQLALEDLLSAASWENSFRKRDVAWALASPSPYLVATAPWRPVTLPAVIPAAHFDLGTQNLAYGDKDYQAASYPVSAWNQGWSYRNEGVDLSDLGGFYPVVSHVEKGEWLQYTLKVASEGSFSLSLRYAAPPPGDGPAPRIRLEWNGTPVFEADLPSTGDWRKFENYHLGEVSPSPGVHTLKITFLEGGADLSQIRILPAGR